MKRHMEDLWFITLSPLFVCHKNIIAVSKDGGQVSAKNVFQIEVGRIGMGPV